MIKKEWKINDSLMTKPLIERLLSVRGIGKSEEKDFLDPLGMTLLSPKVFCDMDKAVLRIEKAIKEQEKILIYGDFDADGVTSASLLVRTFRHLGANFDYYIPSRETDGHGLNSKALVKLMVSVKPKLIITVDCGISNIEEVNFINSFKKDIIITDHHESGDILPDAYAIINPKAQNSLSEELTSKEILYMTSLAGVGVAFKLAQAVLNKFDKIDYSVDLLPYVAVGTIADIVPLIGENRYFVIKGLDLISKGKHYGLKRLLESAGYNNIEDGLTADKIAFGVAPRINACGRLDSVKDAVNLLISDSNQEIELSVMALNNFNKIRQELESKIVDEADKMASRVQDNIIVLYKEDWHIGIIGIAASHLVEKYGKPTFLMTYSENTNQIRCSARGIEGCNDLNLHDIISNISDKLDGFGGHALAAGLYFTPDKVSFEEVKSALIKSYNDLMQNKKPIPVLNIDTELEPEEITEDLVKDISRLEPFGASNPSPLFAVKDFKLIEKKLMGSNNDHLRLTVEKDGCQFNAIWWSYGDIGLKKDDTLDIAFSPQLNTFNNKTSIQLIIKDIHSDCLVEQEESKVITYDNRKKTDILDKVNEYLKTAKFDFSVFAENNAVVQSLKTYPEIYKRIVTRMSMKQTDGLMFFDYPPTEDIMQGVLEKVSPVRIHYMAYDIDNTVNFDYFKTVSGMIKYACNNKNGKFDLYSSACFLGLTPSMIEVLLEMFEDCGAISILERDENYFILKYIKPINEEDCNKSENYELFKSLLSEVAETRKEFLTGDVSSLAGV
mgnify:CR=1 FL=1